MRFRVHGQAQHLDDLHDRLTRRLIERLTARHRSVVEHRHALLNQGPYSRIRASLVLLPQLSKRLEQEARRGIVSRRQSVAALVATLDALSPLAILARGFSILRTVPEGRMVRQSSDVVVGQTVRARLGEGQLVCVVRETIEQTAS